MKSFGFLSDGREVFCTTLKNKNGMEVDIATMGATVEGIRVPDKNGKLVDVVLGYDCASEDEKDKDTFFGKVVGRNCNRIRNAYLEIDGVGYQLEKNSGGIHNLHSGTYSSANLLWDVKEETETKLVLSCFLPDMEQGFPGNMTITVNYTLTDDDTLVLDFTGISDKNTVCNLTNHMYFNLDGHDQGNACDNSLQLNCSYMTPFDSAESIPNGTLRAVEGTPMDFLKLHPINDKINEDYDQLSYGAGYDHNYCIDNYDGSMQVAAIAKGNQTGICMEIATDCPGIQLYAGNFIGERHGKGGATYLNRSGYALETQLFPNACNEPRFKSSILKAGDTYKSTTTYRFYVEK